MGTGTVPEMSSAATVKCRAKPVQLDEKLPEVADVVVVGGGIAGICSAYYLAKRGLSVVVVEKGRVAGEQSSRAFGWVSNLGLDPVKMELTIESKRLWKEFADTVGPDKIGYKRSGLMHICRSEQDQAMEQGWLDAVSDYDLDARMLTASEVDRNVPGSNKSFHSALYQASDGKVEPELATSVLAEAARAQGVKIFAPCAARGIESSAGEVSAVMTELGRVRCNQVVLAGGAWSRLFCGNQNIYLPQLAINSSLLRTAPITGGPTSNTYAQSYAFRRTADGGYVLGPTEGHKAEVTKDSFELFFSFLPALKNQWKQLKVSVGKPFLDNWKLARNWNLDQTSPFENDQYRIWLPKPDVQLNLKTLTNMAKDFPALKNARVVEQWAGMIDATPDSIPVISAVDSLKGLYLNTGYSAYGLTMGPAGGKLLSELMTGTSPSLNPSIYRYSRFVDGTKLRVAP